MDTELMVVEFEKGKVEELKKVLIENRFTPLEENLGMIGKLENKVYNLKKDWNNEIGKDFLLEAIVRTGREIEGSAKALIKNDVEMRLPEEFEVYSVTFEPTELDKMFFQFREERKKMDKFNTIFDSLWSSDDFPALNDRYPEILRETEEVTLRKEEIHHLF